VAVYGGRQPGGSPGAGAWPFIRAESARDWPVVRDLVKRQLVLAKEMVVPCVHAYLPSLW